MSILLAAFLLSAAPALVPSMDRVALEVSRSVADAGFEGPMGVYVESSSAPLGRALSSLVSSRLATAKLAPVPVAARDAAAAETYARENDLRSLMRLTVSVEMPASKPPSTSLGANGGLPAVEQLVVRGDVLSTWVNFWSGSTPTRTGPSAVIASRIDADAATLTLAGPMSSVTSASGSAPSNRPFELQLSQLTRLPAQPGAITIADIDGNKRGAIVALVGETLVTWTGDGKQKTRVELTGTWSTRPTREPFGLLSFANGKLVAWSSRKERPEAFVWQRETWRSQGATDGLTVGSVSLATRPGTASFQKELSWAGKTVTLSEPIQQLAVFGTLALGVSISGTAAIARGVAPSTAVNGVGSGSTLADLDGDGVPEVVATTSRASEGDEVRVLPLAVFESAQARNGHFNETAAAWQKRIDGRVVLAASGDIDADGSDEVVLGTWLSDGTGELLVLRRAP